MLCASGSGQRRKRGRCPGALRKFPGGGSGQPGGGENRRTRVCQAGGRRRRRRNRRKEERRLEDATTCPGRSHSASSHLSTGPRPPPRRQTLANLGWTPVSLQWLRLSADPPGSGARDQDSRLQTRAPGAQGARSSAGPSQELRLSAAGGSANRGREGLPWCAPPKRSGVPKHLRSETAVVRARESGQSPSTSECGR